MPRVSTRKLLYFLARIGENPIPLLPDYQHNKHHKAAPMELAQFSLEICFLLFTVAIFAGTLDTLAGGGGLITVPALMMSGAPPLSALATNKLQGSAGTAMATLMMLRKGQFTWQGIHLKMLASLVGAFVGTVLVQFLDTQVLEIVIVLVLAITGMYFLCAPWLSKTRLFQSTATQSDSRYLKVTIPSIGFYDGMFGPGTGSFFTLAGVALKRMPIVEATAQAKALNFASNITSVIVFAFSGQVLWLIGLVMMLGQSLGAFVGAHLLVRINPAYLRWLIVILCFAMLAKLAFDGS